MEVCLFNARSVCNKVTDITEYLLDNDLDIMAITETWLKHDEQDNQITVGDLKPVGYELEHVPAQVVEVAELPSFTRVELGLNHSLASSTAPLNIWRLC
jgi:hypothetical protein